MFKKLVKTTIVTALVAIATTVSFAATEVDLILEQSKNVGTYLPIQGQTIKSTIPTVEFNGKHFGATEYKGESNNSDVPAEYRYYDAIFKPIMDKYPISTTKQLTVDQLSELQQLRVKEFIKLYALNPKYDYLYKPMSIDYIQPNIKALSCGGSHAIFQHLVKAFGISYSPIYIGKNHISSHVTFSDGSRLSIDMTKNSMNGTYVGISAVYEDVAVGLEHVTTAKSVAPIIQPARLPRFYRWNHINVDGGYDTVRDIGINQTWYYLTANKDVRSKVLDLRGELDGDFLYQHY